jgi:hypothetical protein
MRLGCDLRTIGLAIAAATVAAVQPAGAGASSNYTFLDTTTGHLTAPVTMSILAAGLPAGSSHAAVWEMAVDSHGSWLSAGLLVQPGSNGPVVYVETGTDATKQTSLRIVDQVAFAATITIRITNTPRHAWVAWYDGRPVGSARLGEFAQRVASAELFEGATMSFELDASPGRGKTEG